MVSDYEMRLAALKCALEENSRDGWRSIIYKSIQYYRFLADIPDPSVEPAKDLPIDAPIGLRVFQNKLVTDDLRQQPVNASVGQCTFQNEG